MNVTILVDAANQAEALSRYRNKTIRLRLTGDGVAVDGKLIRPDGVVMQRQTAVRSWREIEGNAGALADAIREVDRQLVAIWSNLEPAHEP